MTILRPAASLDRRRLLVVAGGLLLAGTTPARSALPATPRQTEGPFYPVVLPVETDADLVRVAAADGPARGTVTHVAGRILDTGGRPLAGARVEIWQCDADGIYLHPGSGDQRRRDRGFQGFGATMTGADGTYRFRTIRPVPYSGRTPHIHFAVLPAGGPRFVTQMYVAGEPGNDRDVLLRRMDAAARARLEVPLTPAPGIEAGALAGRFDIVLG
ncbi:MAG: intradiol ring-cleavage dioxygenase [Alphaproteobacteria bacterium]